MNKVVCVNEKNDFLLRIIMVYMCMCEPYRKLYVHVQNSLEASLDEEQVNMHTPSPVWKLRDLPPADWTNK